MSDRELRVLAILAFAIAIIDALLLAAHLFVGFCA